MRDLILQMQVSVDGHVGRADEGPDWRALGALWGVAYRLVTTP